MFNKVRTLAIPIGILGTLLIGVGLFGLSVRLKR